MKRNNSDASHPVDVHVGRVVRARRLALDLTQQELAARLGLTFQQIQKYERGDNRLSASRLYDMARALQMPLADFFADYRGGRAAGLAEPKRREITTPVARQRAALLRYFDRITDPALRRQLLSAAKLMARPGPARRRPRG